MEEPEKIPNKKSKAKKKVQNEVANKLIKHEGGYTDELVDHYWGSMNYVFSLIKASEVKAGLILSFYGILLNLIYQNIAAILYDEAINPLLITMIGVWIVCTIISIYYSIRCFIPKIEGKYDKNIFFFGDIISKFGTIHEFSQTFYEISLKEEELFDHLGQQIYIISKISAFKFRCVSKAIRFLAVGLLVLFMAISYYTVLKMI